MSICLNVMDRDNRKTCARLQYILEKCCPYKEEVDDFFCYIVYQNLDFMQLKWIIDRCNFLMGKDYGLKFFDYDLLFLLEECDLIPETFKCDWNCIYALDKHGYIKKDKKGNYIKLKKKQSEFVSSLDWLSPADKAIMNKVIKRWKLYGRFFQDVADWWWVNFAGKKLKK